MAARGFLRDASGVPRQGRRLFLRDASGIPRQAKRIFERDASGISRLVYVLGDLLTLVAGTLVVPNDSTNAYGYDAPSPGSLTPSTLGDGSSVYVLLSNYNVAISQPQPGYYTIAIKGIPGYNVSNPVPQSYLNQVIISGPSIGTQTLDVANSQFVRINTDTGSWGWGPGLPPFTPGDTYEVIVVRTNP